MYMDIVDVHRGSTGGMQASVRRGGYCTCLVVSRALLSESEPEVSTSAGLGRAARWGVRGLVADGARDRPAQKQHFCLESSSKLCNRLCTYYLLVGSMGGMGASTRCMTWTLRGAP